MADGEAVELATAYLSLVPTLRGAQGNIATEMGVEGEKAGVSFSDGLKKTIGVAAIVAGVVAGFTGLYKAGAVFDDVSDTIRVGTGATGEALSGLEQVAKNVATAVPTSFEAAGQTVADLNTRLGLSGETLTTVASQYLEAGRILGEQVDVNKTSAAFSAFRIEGDAVSGAMDSLFRTSQATGVSMNDLAAAAQQNAPALQNLGFGFDETISLVGSLDKAGINSTQTLAAMSKGLVTLAKDGEEPQAAFRRVTGEIQSLVAEGNVAGAIDLASGIFGTRAANQFVGAVQSGTLALDDLVGGVGASSDTILQVAAETADFGESWQIVKNNALAALEPLATGVFNLAGKGMGKLAEVAQELSPVLVDMFSSAGSTIGPLIGQVVSLWSQFSPLSILFQALQPVLPVLAAAFGQIASVIGGALGQALTAVAAALTPVVQLLIGQLSNILTTLVPIVVQIAQVLGQVLGQVLVAIGPLIAMLAQLIGQVLMAVSPLIGPILNLAAALLPLLTPIIQLVGALLEPLIGLLTALLQPILALISPLVDMLAGALGVVINVLATVIDWIVKGITWFVNLVTGSKEAGDQFNAVWSVVGKWFSDIWNGIITGLSTAVLRIAQFIGGIRDTVMGALSGIGTWLVDSGKALIQGFLDGINGMLSGIGDVLNGVMDFIGGFFPHSPAERGPFSGSGWTAVGEGGGALADQFIDGFDSAATSRTLSIPRVDALAPRISTFSTGSWDIAATVDSTQNAVSRADLMEFARQIVAGIQGLRSVDARAAESSALRGWDGSF